MKPINTAIKKVCKRGLILPSILIILMLLLFNIIKFDNIFSPITIESTKEVNTLYQQKIRYVEYTFDQLYYTNFDYVKGNKTIGYYYFTILDNTCTFVLISSDHLTSPEDVLTDYSAKAKLISSDSMYKQMLELLVNKLNWNLNGIKQSSSTVLINELDYNEHFYILLFVAMLTLTILCTYLFVSNLIFIAKPELYPACIGLRKYGNRHELLEEINKELNNYVNITSDNTFITNNYFVDISLLSITVLPINQILWAYEHTTWQRFFWIKLKLNFTLNIVGKHNNKASSHRNTKENIEEMLEFLREKHPEILIGFSKDNKRLINKNLRPGK